MPRSPTREAETTRKPGPWWSLVPWHYRHNVHLSSASTLQDLVQMASLAADPSALAVVDPNEAMTYSELYDRVCRLAGLLRSLGVHHGDRVGVQLETSTRTMVAVHAVLRAGSVVVPLDPRAPTSHVGGILRDCSIDVLITDTATKTLAKRIETLGVRTIISTADDHELLTSDSGSSIVGWNSIDATDPIDPVPVAPEDLAYIIFTSGSTGRPKGIAHTHYSGLSYARLAAQAYEVTAADRIAQAPALHFDQSTFGLYSSPLAGATTVMIPESLLAFPASLVAFAAQQQVTIWYSVPTLIMRMVQRGGLDTTPLDHLRWVKFGGEVFPPVEFAAAMQALAPARFSNVYGPAEVNQCMIYHLDVPPPDGGQIPIGRAWDETEIALVQPDRTVVAQGEEGEIVVRSTTAMDGYWNQPDLTAASWCRVPELDGSGEGETQYRWYATGDLAVERPDGELVFLGRRDNQVKVRGHRVELESVEAALIDLPDVAGAAVIVVHEDDGSTRLFAAVEGAVEITTTGLRRTLAKQMPAYAVPDTIEQFEQIPRTPTGKVDRNAVAVLHRGAGAKE